ncbi:MAG: asparagine synthase (glutamine-hydrolyzing) [Chloroflexi bacterium]|nr:asparagine synthase (glutamine-hydrolyzing) [Chloroflexota bacterium]
MLDLTGGERADSQLTRALCAALAHRGPDGDGFYDAAPVTLGMRRLSIIDVAGSDQPLYNEDGSIALVFNGEIYNYRELRADLLRRGHTFRTDGDGETIIHLYEDGLHEAPYEQHGLGLFRHLRGMYAFALWDARRARLILAVDHIGMKPLYLYQRDGLLRFASEIKALCADESIPAVLNLPALDTYLSFGYMLGSETLFAGIERLPPGHALIAEGGETRCLPYWTFGDGFAGQANEAPGYANDEAVIEAARERLIESVGLHLRSDVPLGLFLSGGIDSAAVLALMRRAETGPLKTFTVGYAMQTPDNELLAARRIAAHFGAEHHERVIDADDWWRGLEHYAHQHDEPNANPSAVSLLLLSEITAQEVKVVLTGLGGDELFGGYSNHRTIPWVLAAHDRWGRFAAPLDRPLAALEAYYPAFKRYRIIGALPTYLPRWRQALLPPEEGLLRLQSFDGLVFTDALRAQLYGADLQAAAHEAHKQRAFAAILARSQHPDPANLAQRLVINTWLTGNALLSNDKVTMAHSLEARVPFFDPALMALAAAVPPDLRMRRNKHVLREAARPYLPAFALERPKQPFSTPILGWFAADLRARIEAVLLDDGAFTRDLIDRRALERLLRDHFSGRAPQVEVVFRLLLLELWAGAFRVRRAEQRNLPLGVEG